MQDFLQLAGANRYRTVAVTHPGFSPFSYAQNEKVRLGVIGTGGQGNIHIRGGLAGTPELGMLVPNHRIREAAWKAVCDLPGLDLFDRARIHAVRTTDDHACVTLGDGLRLEAPLLVAADSRFSETRRAMGIGADQYDFGKSMLVCRMHHEQPHEGVAWEWFGHGQTLALLPLQEHQASVVVTLPDSAARRLAALDVEAFAREMVHLPGNRIAVPGNKPA